MLEFNTEYRKKHTDIHFRGLMNHTRMIQALLAPVMCHLILYNHSPPHI